MIFGLNIFLTSLELPRPDVLVLVEGGIARWDGKNWISCVEDNYRVIQWEVKWWADLPVNPFEINSRT